MSLVDVYRDRVVQNAEHKLKDKTKEIVRCYRHSWDIYSELLQNAVDAINRRYRILNDPDFFLYDEFRDRYKVTADQTYKGAIRITIDVPNRAIQIEDNGVGIETENMERFLLPGEGGKIPGREYGFKGYGLTFAAFISREFRLRSKFFQASEGYEIELNGLLDWLVDQDNSVPFPASPTPTARPTSLPEGFSTVVRVRLDDCYETRFPAVAASDLAFQFIQSPDDWDRLEYILRSRTAVGNTKPLFNQPPIVPIDVNVVVLFADGSQEERVIQYLFYHPREHPEINISLYDFADYVERLKQVSFDRFFRGLYHTIDGQSVGTRNPIDCSFALLAASSTRLSNIESALKLDQLASGDVDVSYGVYLSIDGMPTGIQISNWKSHDQQRYYVIVDAALDVSDQLDSGRKGISTHFADLISEHAWELIKNAKADEASDPFSSFAGKYLDIGRASTSILPPQDFQDKVIAVAQEGQQQQQEYPDLIQRLRDKTSLLYFPSDEQEAIMVFYSLLSRGVIKGYKTIYLSGRATYDAAFDYEIECIDANIHPTDPLGVGELLVEQLGGSSRSASSPLKYCHRERFRGITDSAELCVEFKPTIGHLLEELNKRPSRTDKRADAIDLLIVWDDTIPSSVSSASYTLARIQGNRRIFHSTTHKLGLIGPQHTEIFCIVLKDVLETMTV
jgi:hypothetical protein